VKWTHATTVFSAEANITVRSCRIKKTTTNWLLIFQTTLASFSQRISKLSKSKLSIPFIVPVEKCCQKDLAGTFPLMSARAAVAQTDHEFHLRDFQKTFYQG
jgi:hypothetical protein